MLASAFRDPAPADIHELTEAVRRTAHILARRICTHPWPDDSSAMGSPHSLATLRVLRAIDELVGDLAAEAAHAAGHDQPGASYTDLGNAWGITKQSAATKWRGAVPPKTGASTTITIRGRAAEIFRLPDGDWSWRSTRSDGTPCQAEEPYPDDGEATAAACDFLRGITTPPTAAERSGAVAADAAHRERLTELTRLVEHLVLDISLRDDAPGITPDQARKIMGLLDSHQIHASPQHRSREVGLAYADASQLVASLENALADLYQKLREVAMSGSDTYGIPRHYLREAHELLDYVRPHTD
ncbi:hypothetical protein ABZW18_30805 [Streptomyces sp. NPDC004647]|uniref:hypothetical protein n=1 Tax=Streptomyces sp. NPDC004647 TaxID=3154671 RepID=UPI0033B35C59